MSQDPNPRRTIRDTPRHESRVDKLSTQETLDADPAPPSWQRGGGRAPAASAGVARGLLANPWFKGGLAVAAISLFLAWFLPLLIGRIELASERARIKAEREAGVATGGASDAPPVTATLKEISRYFQDVSSRVRPTVVHIDVTRSAYDRGRQEELRQLFGNLSPEYAPSQGSGLIVDSSGYVLTNYHVVVGARSVRVTLHDESRHDAKLVGDDPLTDLALLKIERDGLPEASWGDSDEVATGALVWAIGSPFGLQQTMTFGIVSKKRREGLSQSQYQEFLQTDAAINPGNSGGPLVDVNGDVIGINTAILGESYAGVGFAIPSNIARDVYEGLRSDGEIARGWLGVGLADVSGTDAARLGLPKPSGALVVSTSANDPRRPSPAVEAGIRADDVILQWNGREVTSSIMLSRQVAQTEIGSTVPVVVLRDHERLELRVTVGRRPE